MKTRILIKCMFAGLLLAAFVSVSLASGKENASKYYYDSGGAKSMAESQAVYILDENGQFLTPKIKYFFRYDKSGRVIEKKALRWDTGKKDWGNAYLLNFTYEEDFVTIEYATWNKSTGEYDDFSQRTTFKVDANMITAVNRYRKCTSNDCDWNLEYSYLYSTPSVSPWHENAALIAGIEE